MNTSTRQHPEEWERDLAISEEEIARGEGVALSDVLRDLRESAARIRAKREHSSLRPAARRL
ncbi:MULTISPECIES: hypothetical protein [Nitrospirillum]|uniref:hypothetical protein n=1 Tax=Nitrospirillum TaxID=1543705 RepID=UPI0011A2BB8E|nr:hypothetical protein [Nitrospirillum amazonense]MEC4591435.1 hypothetical protein [Nitrospirillum amazonense]